MKGGRRFELIRTLGAGSYGTVYLADMVSTGDFRKKVALKLLNAQQNSEDGADAARRLRDEARLLGRLRHRHIVQVDDLVRLDGKWAVVMEYVAGLDLEVLQDQLSRRREAFPLRAVAEVIQQSAAALDAAWNGTDHEAAPLRVIHRDIKPSNLRLTASGDIKVLDFGIARVEMDEREAATGQYLMGTLAYIAPERMLGDPEAPSGDIYSLGCVLYELIVGKRLGRVQLAPDKQKAQVKDALGRFWDRVEPGPGVEDLMDLLGEMLSYTAGNRPTAAQVSQRARAIAQGMEGESLAVFAGRLIPEFLALAGQAGAPTSGVLLEGVEPTLAVPTPDGQAVVLPDTQPATRAWGLWAAIAGAALLVVGIGWGIGSGKEGSGPESAGGPPVVVRPAPAPAPEPEPEPVVVTPEPRSDVERPAAVRRSVASPAAKEPVRSAPAAPTAPRLEEAVSSDAVRLRAIKFVQDGGEEMRVSCGDVSGRGSASVLLRNAPAGRCTVIVDGRRATVMVSEPRGVDCTLTGGGLTCR